MPISADTYQIYHRKSAISRLLKLGLKDREHLRVEISSRKRPVVEVRRIGDPSRVSAVRCYPFTRRTRPRLGTVSGSPGMET